MYRFVFNVCDFDTETSVLVLGLMLLPMGKELVWYHSIVNYKLSETKLYLLIDELLMNARVENANIDRVSITPHLDRTIELILSTRL